MELTENQIFEITLTSPALIALSELYPPNRYGKVPLKIKMATTVSPDIPFIIQPKPYTTAICGNEYYVWCNSHGAMSAILPNGEKLGIRPAECEITQWHQF